MAYQQCDCCKKPRKKLHLILPADRYVAIDPVGDAAGNAIHICDWWLAEREQQKKKRDERWKVWLK